MMGSWLIVKWVVAGTAGLCVGASLITWMTEGNEFVCEKPGQRLILVVGLASFMTSLASRLWFVLGGVIFAGVAIILLRDLVKKGRAWLRAES